MLTKNDLHKLTLTHLTVSVTHYINPLHSTPYSTINRPPSTSYHRAPLHVKTRITPSPLVLTVTLSVFHYLYRWSWMAGCLQKQGALDQRFLPWAIADLSWIPTFGDILEYPSPHHFLQLPCTVLDLSIDPSDK